ncbi:hypothetical protein ACWDR1_35835, partial [Streptosporangium sandarakinum]
MRIGRFEGMTPSPSPRRPPARETPGRRRAGRDADPPPSARETPGRRPRGAGDVRHWRDMPKVVFSSTIDKVDWNTRLVTGDAV